MNLRRPSRLTVVVVCFLIFVPSLYIWSSPQARDRVIRAGRPAALWLQGYTRYNFQPTEEEVLCYNGNISRHNAVDVSTEIPRVVHFVWGLKEDGSFPFKLYLAIRSALISIKPTEVRLHYTNIDRENRWLRAIEHNITFVHHDPANYLAPFLDLNPDTWHIAHMADVLRLTVLAEEGGIYLDADIFVLRPLDRLLQGNRDVVMGHEGGNRWGLTNAIILAKRRAPFIKRWLDRYDSFDESQWNYHSVQLPRALEKEYPDELCAVSPTVFYWPMWDEASGDWLHQPLSPDEARAVEETVRKNEGGLFETQLALHGWGKSKFYLPDLTPERMRKEDTRFNILMRPFLED